MPANTRQWRNGGHYEATGRQLQADRESNDSLGCVRAAGSPVTDVQRAPLLPVLGEGGAHVALQPLDGPDHQVVHWNPGRRETVSTVSESDPWRRHPAAPARLSYL